MSGSTRRGTRGLKAFALLAVAALIFTGCGSSDSSSSSSDGGSSGSSSSGDFGDLTMQYSWIKNEEFAGEYYAEENGYYEDAGFSKVTGISGPDTGVAKLLSGKVQVALSDSASIGAAIAEQDAPLKIIGATFQKNPFTILSLKDGGNIETPQDLVGKKIGVQDSNASVFAALLKANDIDPADVTVVPVEFDPTPLTKGDVDGFMAYLTNESISVQNDGYEVTNLPYADNGVPFVAETYTVTDQYLAENKDLLKAFLTAEIKGWTDVYKEPTDATVDLITKVYNAAASDSPDGMEATFGALDPDKTAQGLEAEKELISTSDTEENGLFTITDELKDQTIASLKAAGWDLKVEDLFDTTIIDEIYKENPDLKEYQP